MDAKTGIAKMVQVLIKIEELNDDLKGIKDDLKESGLNVAVLSAVAKAVVSGKLDELKEKSNETLEAIDVANS